MTKRKKYLYADRDRHGNQRFYFKPPGHKKTRIKFAPGTPEANAEYDNLMRRFKDGQLVTSRPTTRTGTLDWLFKKFEDSANFKSKAENTRIQRSNFYRRIARVHGHIAFDTLTGQDLAKMRDALAAAAVMGATAAIVKLFF